MREPGTELTRVARAGRAATLVLVATLAATGCSEPDPELIPDARLQEELGLEPGDRVHTITLRTGVGERARPDSVLVLDGDFVQFVSDDWLVHEIRFDLEGLPPDHRAFLERTGQDAGPPLLERDARFVVSFAEAPPGRYPYLLEGNREPGGGLIVVAAPDAR